MHWFLFLFGCGFFLFDCGRRPFGVAGTFLEPLRCAVFLELVLLLVRLLPGGVFTLVFVFAGTFLLGVFTLVFVFAGTFLLTTLGDFFGVGVVAVSLDVVFLTGGSTLEVNNAASFVVAIGLLLFFGSNLMRFNMLADGSPNFCSASTGFSLAAFCLFRNIIFWKNVAFAGSASSSCCPFEVFGGEFCFAMFPVPKLFEFPL